MGQSCQKLSCIRTLKKRRRLASERLCTSQVYIGTTPECAEVTLFEAYNASVIKKPSINRSVVSLVPLTDKLPATSSPPPPICNQNNNFLTIPGTTNTRAAPLSSHNARGVPLHQNKPYNGSVQQVRISPLPRPSSPLPTETLPTETPTRKTDRQSGSVLSLKRGRVAPCVTRDNSTGNNKIQNGRRFNGRCALLKFLRKG